MKLSHLIMSTTLALTGLLVATGQTNAYRGDPNLQGPNYSQERHQAMIKAFENNDYQAWKNLMLGRGRVNQVINEKNFARFAEMHRLMLQGKTTEAAQIRAELGLGFRSGQGWSYGKYGQGCAYQNR